jgi:prepilin signal peptidase PulO-like enzyme (type II secretory pathway)
MEFFYSYLPWIVGILGLIVGSFLNVVVLRFGLGDGLGGRSHCPQCHKKLQWYELIPVISFLIQHAKCRGCKKNISWDYSIGELLTGIMFFFSTLYIISLFWNPFAIIFWIGLSIFLVVISFVIIIVLYDIKTRTVPLVWFLGLIISSFLFLIIYYYSFQELHITTTIPHLLGIMGAMPFLVVYLFSSGRLIGFADIEIMAWIGLFLGIWMRHVVF